MATFTAVSQSNFLTQIAKKQDKLTAGTNITISDDGTISSDWNPDVKDWSRLTSWMYSTGRVYNVDLSGYSEFLLYGKAKTTANDSLNFTINGTSFVIVKNFFSTTERNFLAHFVINKEYLHAVSVSYNTDGGRLYTEKLSAADYFPLEVLKNLTQFTIGSGSTAFDSAAIMIAAR